MKTALSGSQDEPVGGTRRDRPTMKDVAALSGVSIKTVSRVINGETTVAVDLAMRVRRAAEQLSYRPDLTASSLRRSDRKTLTIGLLLENLANPFSSTLQRSVEQVARPLGVSVLAASLDEDADLERHLVTTLLQRRVDGLLMAPASSNQGYLLGDQQAGAHVVFVDRPPAFLEADAVLSDNTGGAYDAVSHLIAAGHQRIGFLGDLSTLATARARYEGYLTALRERGLAADPRRVHHDIRTSEAAQALMVREVRRADAPTAWFTSQNLLTIGAVKALRQLGLQHRVALVGFDDLVLGDLLDPGLSVVAQDVVGMGRLAAQRLFSRIAGETAPASTIILPTQLIARGSGEIPPPA